MIEDDIRLNPPSPTLPLLSQQRQETTTTETAQMAFYKQNYKIILASKDYTMMKFRVDHKDYSVPMERFDHRYFHYLKTLASAYKTTLQSYVHFSSNDTVDITDETFKDFQVFLAMLVHKFSRYNNLVMTKDSCADYVQDTTLVTKCMGELALHNGNVEALIRTKFHEKVDCNADTFNETKVRAFYNNDREYDKLLDLAKNGVDFEVDPDFVANTSVEPLRPLHKDLHKVYKFHVDKLVKKGRALIFDLRQLTEEQKNSLNICSLHLVPKPSSDTIPIDPVSNDRKGRLCFDLSNRHDGRLSLNGGRCKELNIQKYGEITNPTAAIIVLRWVYWKLEHRYKWNQCILCRQDIDAAFNRLWVNPKKALFMTAGLDEHHVVVHTAGNFGHSSLPAAYGNISRATKRLIEKDPKFKGVLSVVCDDYIFLTLKEDHDDANEVVMDVIERRTLGKGSVGLDKKLLGQEVGVYGFMVNLKQGSIRPMDKGIQKLTASFWLFDVEQRQPEALWQCLASLCEYYSHAIRGARPLIRIFEEMSTTCKAYADRKAKATPLTKAIIELWRIITLVLFINKDAYNVSLEDFCKSYHKYKLADLWVEIEQLEATPTLRIAMTSDAGPHFIGATIHEVNPTDNVKTLLAYTSLHIPFDDPDKIYQGLREYIGLLVSLLMVQTYKIRHQLPSTKTNVEWYGDNNGALTWADSNKAKPSNGARVAQCANLLITWFPIVTNLNLSFTKHISGDEMIRRGVDALSRPEKGIPHNFPPHLYMDIQQKTEDSGILALCSPHFNNLDLEDIHLLFKEINSSINSFFHA